jgi:hypothetical protein
MTSLLIASAFTIIEDGPFRSGRTQEDVLIELDRISVFNELPHLLALLLGLALASIRFRRELGVCIAASRIIPQVVHENLEAFQQGDDFPQCPFELLLLRGNHAEDRIAMADLAFVLSVAIVVSNAQDAGAIRTSDQDRMAIVGLWHRGTPPAVMSG